MGFVPNSMLIMARDPELLAAFAELSAIIVVRLGRLDPGLKALIMYMVSRSAGCQHCAAHSAERAALRFAQAAGHVPNAVGDTEFAELRRHFDDDQILEMVAVVALLGFLNRWNFAECHLAAAGWNAGKHLDVMPIAPQPRRPTSLRARLFLWLLRRSTRKRHYGNTIHIKGQHHERRRICFQRSDRT